MKRITRSRRLTPEEARKYQASRQKVADELPDLIARHHERMATLDQLQEVIGHLKAAREAKGLTLSGWTAPRFRSSRPANGPTRRSTPWCATPKPWANACWFR